jgi:UDPglucose 6-dehydrogenase
VKLAVYGMGYLGVTHATCMAEVGHQVLGVEIDSTKLEKLQGGELPFYEPGLDGMLARHVESGQLQLTDSYPDAACWGAIHFITVGTPQKTGEFRADITHVMAVIDSLAPLLTQDSLIVGKSTVPVGTVAQLAERVRALAPNIGVEVCWNPEFVREGHAVADTLNPARIVIGVPSGGQSERILREVYAPLCDNDIPFVVTDPVTAELVKGAANAFLATKISFINAIAEVCEAVGADIQAVADAIGHDPRIGRKFLNAGLGFGGGCLPKDIRAFSARAGELGVGHAMTFLREVDAINMRRRSRMVELAGDSCHDGLLGARIGVLGAAFKPGSDDVRDSPALAVAGSIQLQGATVTVYDPKAEDNSRAIFPTLNYAPTALDACRGADVILVVTEWPEFMSLDPVTVSSVTSGRVIIDGRNCLDRTKWEKAGWRYRC